MERPPPVPLAVPRACMRIGVACVSTLALYAEFGCRGDHAAALITVRAERRQIERIVVATGTIEPEKEVEVRPRVPGIVEHILVKEGEVVREGQLLVEIDREILQAQADEATAALDEARVQRRFAEAELRRAVELERSGARSKQQVEDMQARFDGAEAAVARADALRKSLTTQLSYARVLSPLAGRVLSIPVEVGSAVSPVTAVTGGTLLLSLAATDTLHLDGKVDENEVARVVAGQPARIRTEAFPERVFAGQVREIAPLGERIQNVTYFKVKIEVTDPEARVLKPRMSGDADIVTQVIDDALTVPETALRYRGDEIYVESPAAAGAAQEHRVKIGIVDGKRVQVLDGLAEGDMVVLQ